MPSSDDQEAPTLVALLTELKDVFDERNLLRDEVVRLQEELDAARDGGL